MTLLPYIRVTARGGHRANAVPNLGFVTASNAAEPQTEF
jgi:hypothetical protein